MIDVAIVNTVNEIFIGVLAVGFAVNIVCKLAILIFAIHFGGKAKGKPKRGQYHGD